MIALVKICVNDIFNNIQRIRTVVATGSETGGFFSYLYLDKKDGRVRVDMITADSLLPGTEVELIRANPKKIFDYFNNAIIEFNKGNIDVSDYPIIRNIVLEIKQKYKDIFPLEEVKEPSDLSAKYEFIR